MVVEEDVVVASVVSALMNTTVCVRRKRDGC